MRTKTTDFLKVLNRARSQSKNTEKKTITYVHPKNITKYQDKLASGKLILIDYFLSFKILFILFSKLYEIKYFNR